jgi:hypothetical protein
MWGTLNQHDVSYAVTYLAGFACLGLSLFCVWIISLAVARPADELPDESLAAKLKALVVGTEAPTPSYAGTAVAGTSTIDASRS